MRDIDLDRHLTIASILLAHGALADSPDMSNYTPLHLAAERGHTAMCELLMRDGRASGLARSSNGSSPMHLACHKGDARTVVSLLQRMLSNGDIAMGPKAFEPLRNNWGSTPPDIARARGHHHLAEHLEDAVLSMHERWQITKLKGSTRPSLYLVPGT